MISNDQTIPLAVGENNHLRPADYRRPRGFEQALKLVPLIQITDKPQPVSYFYNRQEGSQFQLITYQAAVTSEISSDLVSLGDLIQELSASGTEN